MTGPQLEHLVLFLDDPETAEEAGLVAGLARVVTAGGPVMVPGMRHLDVPQLAVTSCHLGAFDVTHLPSGRTMVRGLDTMGHALLVMAKIHAIRVKYALDLTPTDPKAIREGIDQIAGFPVPFAHPPYGIRQTVKAWFENERADDACALPWETPAVLIREAIEMIAMVSTPIMVTPPVEVPRAG